MKVIGGILLRNGLVIAFTVCYPQMFSSCCCGTPFSDKSSSYSVNVASECWVLGLLWRVIISSLPLVRSLAPLGPLPVSARLSIFGGSFLPSGNSPLPLYKPPQVFGLDKFLNSILQCHAFICGVTVFLVKTTMLSHISVPGCGCLLWGVNECCM